MRARAITAPGGSNGEHLAVARRSHSLVFVSGSRVEEVMEGGEEKDKREAERVAGAFKRVQGSVAQERGERRSVCVCGRRERGRGTSKSFMSQ